MKNANLNPVKILRQQHPAKEVVCGKRSISDNEEYTINSIVDCSLESDNGSTLVIKGFLDNDPNKPSTSISLKFDVESNRAVAVLTPGYQNLDVSDWELMAI